MPPVVRVGVVRSGVIEESRCIRGSLSRFSLTWIGHPFVRLSRGCVVFSCVARRVSSTSDVARVSVVSRERGVVRWYRRVFRRIRVASFVVRRFSFFVNLALSFVVISFLPFFVLSFWRTHPRFRIVLLRVPFSFSRAVSVCRLSFRCA